eukprot:TRINITY_DN15934_c0_g1_i2.p1 TRINITY_DN15934_c0_g1~~TRINITY_DN15934_c0_g1_i2.p1  ORF type:complete len:349 (-),score=49.84 TRINITY_DN15934_c0_g1_i2:651-1697(-)
MAALQSFFLEKLDASIASSARIAQKKLSKIDGGDRFSDIFGHTDAALAAIKIALRDIREGVAEADQTPVHGSSGARGSLTAPASIDVSSTLSSDSGEAVLADLVVDRFGQDGALLLDHVDTLVHSRLEGIRPVLRTEVLQGIGVPVPNPSHVARLRRNVSAHPRGDAAGVDVATLSASGLRRAQKSAQPPVAARLADLEAKYYRLESLIGAGVQMHHEPDAKPLPPEEMPLPHEGDTPLAPSESHPRDTFAERFNEAFYWANVASSHLSSPGFWSKLNIRAPVFVPGNAPVTKLESKDDSYSASASEADEVDESDQALANSFRSRALHWTMLLVLASMSRSAWGHLLQ